MKLRGNQPFRKMFVASFLYATTAHADLWGGDIPILSSLLVQSTETVSSLNQSLEAARASYSEVRRLAGWAEEAREAFTFFSKVNTELQSDARGQFDAMFPELAQVREEASRVSAGGRLGEPDGELRRLVSICLTGGNCHQAREAVSFQNTRQALQAAFGIANTRGLEIADTEAAVSLSASSAQEGRSASTRAYADALMRQCLYKHQAGHSTALASCQAAAAAANIAQLRSNTDIADGIAQSNRLSAVRLALEAERRKAENTEALERRDVLLDGVNRLSNPAPRIESEGWDLTKELR